MFTFFYFLLFSFIFACQKNEKLDNLIFEEENLTTEEVFFPAEEFEEITMIVVDNGLIQLKLFGQKLYRYEQYQQNFNVTKVEDGLLFSIYEADGNQKGSLKAQKALIFSEKDQITFEDQVKYDGGDGILLETNFLYWDKNKGSILVPEDQEVTVIDHKKGNIIKGFGLVSDANFSNYILHKVSGLIQLEDSEEKE